MSAHRSKTILMAVVAVFMLAAAAGAAGQADYNMKIKFGLHFQAGVGQSSAQLYDMIKGITDSIGKNYGIDIAIVKYPSNEAVEEAFLKKEIDSTLFMASNVLSVTEQGGSVHPLVTLHVGKQKKMALCMWEKKGAVTKNVSGLSGKKLILSNESLADLLFYLREYLYQNGVDAPLWKVFGSFISVPSSNSSLISLAAGEGDFFWQSNDYKSILKLISPNLATQVSYSMCSDAVYARGSLVLNEKSLSKEKIQNLDRAFATFLKNFSELAKKDPRVNAIKQYLNLSQTRLLPANPDEYAYELKLFQDPRKRGWIAESRFIAAQIDKAPNGKPVVIKPDYAYCKNSCSTGQSQTACIDKCMK